MAPLPISILALMVAIISGAITYFNYKINKGEAWAVDNPHGRSWRLVRKHHRPAKIIKVAITPSYLVNSAYSLPQELSEMTLKGEQINFLLEIEDSKRKGDLTFRVFYRDHWFAKFINDKSDPELMKFLLRKIPRFLFTPPQYEKTSLCKAILIFIKMGLIFCRIRFRVNNPITRKRIFRMLWIAKVPVDIRALGIESWQTPVLSI